MGGRVNVVWIWTEYAMLVDDILENMMAGGKKMGSEKNCCMERKSKSLLLPFRDKSKDQNSFFIVFGPPILS